MAFFTLVSFIKDNWNYFRNLYSIESSVFRNDFAFSIALHIFNDKYPTGFARHLPGKIAYAADKDFVIDIRDNKIKFLVEKKDHMGEYIAVSTNDLDVHIMNKMSLSRFIDGGSGV